MSSRPQAVFLDLAAAQAAIDRPQPSKLLAKAATRVAVHFALGRRDPERTLERLGGLNRDPISFNILREPAPEIGGPW